MKTTNRLDRRSLKIYPLAERKNKLDIKKCAVYPGSAVEALPDKELSQIEALAGRIIEARRAGRPVMLTCGAHLVKNGVGPVVIRMIEDGWLTHIAGNGAASIHDWEFAYQGLTSEDVREYIAEGRFGGWKETGRYINLAVAVGAASGLGYGRSVGRMIADNGLEIPSREELIARLNSLASQDVPDETIGAVANLLYLISTFDIPAGFLAVDHPFAEFSIQAAASMRDVDFTVHPGIGYDIIYTHPWNCGGSIGSGATLDFLCYAQSVAALSGGVHITVGSAVMAPMVFEKSMSMANNLSIQKIGKPITDHYLCVVDIQDGGNWDWSHGEPPVESPAYYLRFCKSFYRMGGTLDYICLDNRDFMLGLHRALTELGGKV